MFLLDENLLVMWSGGCVPVTVVEFGGVIVCQKICNDLGSQGTREHVKTQIGTRLWGA